MAQQLARFTAAPTSDPTRQRVQIAGAMDNLGHPTHDPYRAGLCSRPFWHHDYRTNHPQLLQDAETYLRGISILGFNALTGKCSSSPRGWNLGSHRSYRWQ
jgi:hypothetical protein